MGLDLRAPILPKIGRYRFLSIIVFLGLLNASLGFAYVEGQSSEITVLYIDGAPNDIVVIADPHLREENIDHTREVVDEINALDPSMVLILGDFVYKDGEDLHLQEVWSGIDAPVYAILGNHDYKSGIDGVSWVQKHSAVSSACLDAEGYDVTCLRDGTTDLAYAEEVVGALEENGVTVLRNEYVPLNLEGTDLLLVGVDDGWAGMADPPVIPETDAFVLYMIHEPDCRADWDADLVIAGHTHGGQFLPQGTPLPGKELSGLYERNDRFCYVTRGIGTSNFGVELRLFATPEIVIINPSVPPEDLLPGKKVVHITVE
ncbi:MAG: metallophosphoesterase [Methanomicrobiales archaeon]|nr:metallophosphoesterase [Methanomicrobiales archaeon]NYT21060.1 metallophosphoesterase [Methanomicrobiales archaeon]